MNSFMDALAWFMNQIFSTPLVFLGIVLLLGFLLQRKPFEGILEGTITGLVGFQAMQIGVGALIAGIDPANTILKDLFGIEGVIAFNESAWAFAIDKTTPINVAYFTFLGTAVGYIVHLLIARYGPFKHVYLTGHTALQHAMFVALIWSNIGLRGGLLLVVVALDNALFWSIFPAAAHYYSKRFIPDDAYQQGHAEQLTAAILCAFGRFVGKPSDSIEKADLPKWIESLMSLHVLTTLAIFLYYACLVIIASPATITAYSGGMHWATWVISQALWTAAGLALLLVGVRMLIGAIVPAFRGIADKVVPGARPALDIPVLFTAGPKALILGFLSGLIGAIIAPIVVRLLGFPLLVIPNPILAFFVGGTTAIYADKFGGWKNALLAGIVATFWIHFGVLYHYPMSDVIFGSGLAFGNTDYSWMGMFYALIGVLTGTYKLDSGMTGLFVVSVIVLAIGIGALVVAIRDHGREIQPSAEPPTPA